MKIEERNRLIVVSMAKMTSLLGDLEELEDMPEYSRDVKQKGNMFKKSLEKTLKLITDGMDKSAMEQYIHLTDGINWCENELNKLIDKHILVDKKPKDNKCTHSDLVRITGDNYVCSDCKELFKIEK